eukprot:31073-Pelagococcus_subviridis.AAC.1
MRRKKSLRNGVHDADGVVRGPVYRTHRATTPASPPAHVTSSTNAAAAADALTLDGSTAAITSTPLARNVAVQYPFPHAASRIGRFRRATASTASAPGTTE